MGHLTLHRGRSNWLPGAAVGDRGRRPKCCGFSVGAIVVAHSMPPVNMSLSKVSPSRECDTEPQA